jgi:hypothetical protein
MVTVAVHSPGKSNGSMVGVPAKPHRVSKPPLS